ncbi:DUF6396 domain-containing protein [Vogesella sp. LIG4]
MKWREDFKANEPPEQPPEVLMTQLAAAKELDPKTSRPLHIGHD